jgi:thiamine biosynthesis lipoprotein
MTYFKRIILSCFVLLILSGCGQKKLYSEKRLLMGTVVEVVSPYPEAAGIVFGEIQRIENVFSQYIDSSAVSHLNKSGYLNNNFEVASLVEKSGIFYGLTGGYFDITIAPLSDIWKNAFGENQLPSGESIAEAKSLVGYDKVSIDKQSHSIKLLKSGMRLDFGCIAKGYAVDVAVRELKRKGIDSALVNAGGNMYCLGSKFGRPWIIGLQHPRDKGKMFTNLKLKDSAVATSGDYQQYMEVGGKRYSHIIDPKTGYPVETDVLSVTVVAKDAMTADAVGTCVFLLGREKGLKVFGKYKGVDRIIVITDKDVSRK